MTGKDESARTSRIRELFFEASDYAPGKERQAFLERACEGDPELEQEIQSLFSAYEQSEALLERDLLWETERTFKNPVGTKIGRYQVIEKIGEGGFGEVFRVEQVEPIRRELALKIIKPGMDSRDIIRRFEGERQALARLDHPNIAHIIDAGATESGRPYFVMELAIGLPITKYCDHHCLTVKERLQLFKQVCQGVQHAHEKGLIHRDLNPCNIIIVEKDGQPVPKIIDFGIAKSLQGHLTGKTVLTQRQIFIGTPDYMSPEQFTRTSSHLDARTDIYSMGAVLYELVSGFTPFAGESLSESAVSRIHRIVQEEDPPKPSTLLRTIKDTKEIAESRGSTASNLNQQLRGDLDRIVMKCLEKDRNRRYKSVNSLSRDLEAFLESRPVAATSPSAIYRIHKLLKRNKHTLTGWVAGCALAITLFAVWITFSTKQSLESTAGVAEKSLAILPFENRGNDEIHRYLPIGIHDDILTSISRIPGLDVISRNSVMEYLNTDLSLGEIAEELGVSMILTGSVQCAGNDVRIHVQLIDAANGTILWTQPYDRKLSTENIFAVRSEIADSVAEHLQLVFLPAQQLPTNNTEALEAYYRGIECLSTTNSFDEKKAADYFEKAISLDPQFALPHVRLAQVQMRSPWRPGSVEESVIAAALNHVEKALEIDDTVGLAYFVLAVLHKRKRDYAEAMWAVERSLQLNPNLSGAYMLKAELIKNVPGDHSPITINQERLDLLRKAYELDPVQRENMYALTELLIAQGKAEEALGIKRKTANQNPNEVRALKDLGHLLTNQLLNKFDEAVVLFRKAHAMDPGDIGILQNLWECYWNLNDYETALSWYEKYAEMSFKVLPTPYHEPTAYLFLGDPDSRLASALEILETRTTRPYALWHASEIYIEKGLPAKARELWEKAYPELFQPGVEIAYGQFWPAKNAAYVLMELGKHEQADHLLKEAWKAKKVVYPYDFPFAEAILHAVARNEAETLSAVRRYVNAGGSPRYLRMQSEFKFLNNNPVYQSLLEQAEANMAYQVEHLQEMEARGELSPIPKLPMGKESIELPPVDQMEREFY